MEGIEEGEMHFDEERVRKADEPPWSTNYPSWLEREGCDDPGRFAENVVDSILQRLAHRWPCGIYEENPISLTLCV
jgi:hypothetical protein